MTLNIIVLNGHFLFAKFARSTSMRCGRNARLFDTPMYCYASLRKTNTRISHFNFPSTAIIVHDSSVHIIQRNITQELCCAFFQRFRFKLKD